MGFRACNLSRPWKSELLLHLVDKEEIMLYRFNLCKSGSDTEGQATFRKPPGSEYHELKGSFYGRGNYVAGAGRGKIY